MRLPRPFAGAESATSERVTVQGQSPDSDRNGRGRRSEVRARRADRLLAALTREPLVVLVPLVLAQWLTLLIFVASVPYSRSIIS